MYRVFVLFKYTNLISARGVYCNLFYGSGNSGKLTIGFLFIHTDS